MLRGIKKAVVAILILDKVVDFRTKSITREMFHTDKGATDQEYTNYKGVCAYSKLQIT